MPLIPTRLVWQAKDILAWIRDQRGPEGKRSQAHAIGTVVVDGEGDQAGVAGNPTRVQGDGQYGDLRVSIPDGPNVDAFSRLRVSSPRLRFSGLTDNDKRPLLWSEWTKAGSPTSTYSATSGTVTLDAPADGDDIVRQTKEYFTYRAAQGQLALITFALPGAADSLALVLRSSVSGSPVDRVVEQAAWNIDPMDGTGPSGLVLDPTKAQILVVDFQALFVGRVRYGFDIDGLIVYVHQFENANALDVPYIRHARLPLRYQVSNQGGTVTQRAGYFDDDNGMFLRKVTTESTELECVCAAVIREGGDNEPGIQRAVRMNASYTATTTLTTCLGVRLASDHLRAQLRPSIFDGLNIGTESMEIMLVLNPTVAGTPTWVPAGADSIAEYTQHQGAVTVDAQGLPSSGVVLAHRFVPGGTNQSADPAVDRALGDLLKVVADAEGTTRDIVWIAARTLTSTSAMRASMTFDEIR